MFPHQSFCDPRMEQASHTLEHFLEDSSSDLLDIYNLYGKLFLFDEELSLLMIEMDQELNL